MPLYTFQHTKTGESRDAFFHMDDNKVYRGPEGKDDPKLWARVWLKPQASIDTKADPHSASDFVKVTAKSKGTMGDLWDRSAELSAKRAEKEGGTDPVKQTFYKNYRKKHAGIEHPQEKKEKSIKKLKEVGITASWDD